MSGVKRGPILFAKTEGTRAMVEVRRRSLVHGAAASALAFVAPVARASDVVRIGLTPVFLADQASFLAQWRRWLEARLGRGVEFVQRGTYRDVVDLVRSGKLDFAWICGYPFVRYQRELQLVVTPVWRGAPYYRSYIIVAADDQRTRAIADLRGKVFAYSDPDSNSGCLYPRYVLTMSGENPATFFARTFFTWAHRNVVEAVASGLAAGGAVDGYVWETLDELNPELTRRTRIVERSEPFGHTPFVAPLRADATGVGRFRSVLTNMSEDAAGQALLRQLRLDGFVAAPPSLYDSISRMADRVLPL